MAFAGKNWKDVPDHTTPINAKSLKDLETRLGIYADTKVALSSIGSAGQAGKILAADDPTTTNARLPKGPAGGVLAGEFPEPEFAEDMASLAALMGTTLDDLADVAANAPVARQFVKRNKANTGYVTINDPVVNVTEFGADPTGEADSTKAFEDAIAALPESGGRVIVPPGWYIVKKLVVLKPNIHLEGFGRAGDGVSGSFAGKSTSGTQLVSDEEKGWIIAFGKKPSEGGSVEWRGPKISNVSFGDSSAEHNKLEAGCVLRMMNNGVFDDCAWHNIKNGTAVMEEGDGNGNPQYWHFYTPEVFNCKNGILGGGDDVRIFGGKIQGSPIAAAGAIAGGIGLELNGNGRCYGTALQNNDTDLVLRRMNNRFYGRIETNAALTTPHPTRAIKVMEEASNSIIDTTITNGAAYSQTKFVLIEAKCTGIKFESLAGFTVEATHIENLSPNGVRFQGGEAWQLNSGNKLTLKPNNNSALMILEGGEKTVEKLQATWRGHVLTIICTKEYVFKDSAAEGNLKLASEFTTTADDTLTLICDGTNWFEICRSVN